MKLKAVLRICVEVDSRLKLNLIFLNLCNGYELA